MGSKQCSLVIGAVKSASKSNITNAALLAASDVAIVFVIVVRDTELTVCFAALVASHGRRITSSTTTATSIDASIVTSALAIAALVAIAAIDLIAIILTNGDWPPLISITATAVN